jgi:hypothetical protein
LVIQEGRYDGPENDLSIIPTDTVVRDLAAPHNAAYRGSLSLKSQHFELGVVSPSIAFPASLLSPETFPSLPPYNPMVGGPRPLQPFVSQFTAALNPVELPNTNIFTLSCSGELVRGATADDARRNREDSGSRWPPTFNAHIDQNIAGEPLVTMNLAWVFKYTPGLHLLNFWLPLNSSQSRPLALMDRATLPSDSLANRTEVTFGILSDRYLVTTEATKGEWWFSSVLDRGDAFVFRTDSTPHTSFGRLEADDGVRYSVELRCATVVIDKSDTFTVIGTLVFAVLAAAVALKRRVIKKQN